jgi:hypothetical protein
MKMKELYSPSDWALLNRFKILPSKEKDKVQDEACKLVEDICKTFPKIVMDTNGFDINTKKRVIECLFGPVNQTKTEAMKEGSKFDRFYNLALVAAVIEVMKGRTDGKKATAQKNGDKKTKTK